MPNDRSQRATSSGGTEDIRGRRPSAGRRLLLLLAVLVLALIVAVLEVRGAPPAFPPASVLSTRHITATPFGGTVPVTSQQAISTAATVGLEGREGAPRLVRLTTPGYRGPAWEVSSVNGKFRQGTRVLTGRWVVVFINARSGHVVRVEALP